MRIFGLLLVIFAFVNAAVALKNPICGLPHCADGNGNVSCLAYIPSWSYKSSSNKCVKFIYGGCGGNKNRFESRKACEDMCKE